MKLTTEQIAAINTYISEGPRKDLFTPYIQEKNDKGVLDLLQATKSLLPGLTPIENVLAVFHTFLQPSSGLPVWYLIDKSVNGSISLLNPEGLKAACFMIKEVAKATYPNVDLALSVLQGTLDVLVAANLLTPEQKTTLEAVGYRKLSYVEDLLSMSAESLNLDINDISFILRGV